MGTPNQSSDHNQESGAPASTITIATHAHQARYVSSLQCVISIRTTKCGCCQWYDSAFCLSPQHFYGLCLSPHVVDFSCLWPSAILNFVFLVHLT